ncbi:pyridoxamine 5'-phosphate oxidase family protein [Vineibacter terrae]|uniref:Pyridoxamine 5'-phosphate oxidase family protein n=1 Tax=Vineibacter terrae TaxID=2586908 RepID=A0A5C8PBP3_9HYPH|nr:pyridoxamine 5'-phosphate oxidase family protein [Vineibacter terrae]TXL71221.1 pyridoxamine 5'-phosphate oxidase family protein [Vineibacter terrae]
MTDEIGLAKQFGQSLTTGGRDLPALLAADATFMALNVTLSGRDAVLQRLTGKDTGHVYREAAWTDAVRHGEAVRITARMPDSAPQAGYILLLRFRDGLVAGIQQQSILPARPAPATALRLTPELKALVNDALAARHPMLLAYVDETGQPVVSFRGSTQVFSDVQLAIWVRNDGGGLVRSIARNPKVALMYRDEDKKATYQFQGRAWVAAGARERRQVYEAAHNVERDHDFAELGVAVIIDLDRVEGYAGLSPAGQVGRVNMRREAAG